MPSAQSTLDFCVLKEWTDGHQNTLLTSRLADIFRRLFVIGEALGRPGSTGQAGPNAAWDEEPQAVGLGLNLWYHVSCDDLLAPSNKKIIHGLLDVKYLFR